MQEIVLYFSVIIASYLFGSIPWALIIGRIHGIDIRECGSGNIGATNVTRSVGKIPGKICFTLDFLKGFLPVAILKYFLQDPSGILIICAFAAAVAGHIWSCYIKFKGGKGVSTIAGALLATVPASFLTGLVVWAAVYYTSKYVSLASILAAAVVPFSALILDLSGLVKLPVSLIVFCFVLGALVVVKHRSNIKRLLRGEEHRFTGSGK